MAAKLQILNEIIRIPPYIIYHLLLLLEELAQVEYECRSPSGLTLKFDYILPGLNKWSIGLNM